VLDKSQSLYHAAGCHEVPAHHEWLTPAEAERIESFRYPKRRLETRLSRWTAKQAVGRAMNLPVADAVDLRAVSIRNAADGAPEAFIDGDPAPVSISMTDRADWSVCIVAASSVAVGCDLELVEPRSATFVTDYFTPAEQRAVAADPGHHDLLANTIWSAKESALKVLRTGLRRDTRSVEVRLDFDQAGGWAEVEVRSVEGAVFPGWWCRFDEFVLTCAATSVMPPPASMVEPPPLSAATPAHSWMDEPLR
jgi:4'-phosphopantetheinyl transferase